MNGYDVTKPYKNDIKKLISKTWEDNPYIEVRDGYYSEIRKKHNAFEIDHTDGIGTKGVMHWQQRSFKEAVQDALAMNINDLLLCGAKAYKTQVHLMLPDDDHEAVIAIMQHLSDFCYARKIAITGGETSVHSNLIGLEISLTVSGVITENWRIPRLAKHEDRLVCLPSNGPHSNGFTLLGRLYQGEYKPWMTTPTKLYDHLVLERKLPIHAAMHITGGAFTKIKDILPKYAAVEFDAWNVPEHFKDIYKRYVDLNKKDSNPLVTMYKTFNMGIGMVLAVASKDADWVATAVGGFVGGKVDVSPEPTHSYEKQVVLFTNFTNQKAVVL